MSELPIGAGPRSPRVFISYSHDSPVHSERVLGLAQTLRQQNIDVELDQFHQDKIMDWPRWCNQQTSPECSDFVLCICTGEYARRINGNLPPEEGKGVYWEGTLLERDTYDAKGNRRLIPVLFDDEPESSIPRFLRGWTFCRVRNFNPTDPGYEKTVRILTGQSRVTKSPLGSPARLSGHADPQSPFTNAPVTRSRTKAIFIGTGFIALVILALWLSNRNKHPSSTRAGTDAAISFVQAIDTISKNSEEVLYVLNRLYERATIGSAPDASNTRGGIISAGSENLDAWQSHFTQLERYGELLLASMGSERDTTWSTELSEVERAFYIDTEFVNRLSPPYLDLPKLPPDEQTRLDRLRDLLLAVHQYSTNNAFRTPTNQLTAQRIREEAIASLRLFDPFEEYLDAKLRVEKPNLTRAELLRERDRLAAPMLPPGKPLDVPELVDFVSAETAAIARRESLHRQKVLTVDNKLPAGDMRQQRQNQLHKKVSSDTTQTLRRIDPNINQSLKLMAGVIGNSQEEGIRLAVERNYNLFGVTLQNSVLEHSHARLSTNHFVFEMKQDHVMDFQEAQELRLSAINRSLLALAEGHSAMANGDNNKAIGIFRKIGRNFESAKRSNDELNRIKSLIQQNRLDNRLN